MEVIIAQYLDKMLAFEEAGYVDEALKLSDKILETFESDRAEILIEVAKMRFRSGLVKEALLNFIEVYGMTGSNEVYELILEAYYLPNKENFRQAYCNNMQYLKEYPHYRNSNKSVVESTPIWQDEEIIVFANLKEKKILIQARRNKKLEKEKDKILMVVNELWMEDVLEFERNFRIGEEFMDMDLPIYFVYDKSYWEVFLQLYDMEELIGKNRAVFLVGKENVYAYLKEDMVLPPNCFFYNTSQNIYDSVFQRVVKEQQEEMQRDSEFVKCYYGSHVDDIINRVRMQKPRIVFWTSRFTTALQYHTRDCMQAAARCGCEVELWIESDGIHTIREKDIVQYLARFKPDIIFVIDHFRFEHPDIPEEIVWISWVQDPMPLIMSKETPMRLTNRDFVMSHYTTWKKFKEVGYPSRSLIDAPVPANDHIYKPYILSPEENEKYSCDICFVCHACDVDSHIAEMLQRVPEKLKEALCMLYKGYQGYVYESGEIFYLEKEFKEYITGIVWNCYHITLTSEALNFISDDMYNNFNQRVFRQALADWILDAGFTSLKLWGNGWRVEEKYRKYAMGAAENGETLSKIYQASKIVIGNNVMTTSAARAWEAMLSGSFYLSNYIPEEEDAVDIRKIIEVGKDVVMFYNREDLIGKLHYYLENREEREEMAERGRKAALEKMTYDALMKRVLQEVSERLEED